MARSLSAWWRNLKHSLGDCPGAWAIDVEERIATCHFCGFEDQFGPPMTEAERTDYRSYRLYSKQRSPVEGG